MNSQMQRLMAEDKSISQLLAEAGYSHQREGDDGRHRITETATGREIGRMHAHEAVEFLASLPAGPTTGEANV